MGNVGCSSCILCLQHFEQTKEFLERLPASNKKILALKGLIEDPLFKQQIFSSHDCRLFPSLITRLEANGRQMDEQLAILNEFKSTLKGDLYKLEKSLQKNPDFLKLTICDEVEFKIKTKFAPLVSCDVERSFSRFKAFFRSNRLSFFLNLTWRSTWLSSVILNCKEINCGI